jgi:hypothetical protein
MQKQLQLRMDMAVFLQDTVSGRRVERATLVPRPRAQSLRCELHGAWGAWQHARGSPCVRAWPP